MYYEIKAFFKQVADLHDSVWRLGNAIAGLHDAEHDAAQRAHSTFSSLENSVDPLLWQAMSVAESNVYARARFGLDRLNDLTHAIYAWNNDLQNLHDHYQYRILNMMGYVPTEIWDDMSRYYSPESVRDIDRNGPGDSGNIGWIWDRYGTLAEFDDGSINPRRYEWMETHGLAGVANRLQNQGYNLDVLGGQIWEVDSLMLQFKQQLFMMISSQLPTAYTLPDICHQFEADQSTQTPVKPTLSLANADSLARQMHDNLRSAFLLQQDLSGYTLNSADVQELEQEYQKLYGHSLSYDILTYGTTDTSNNSSLMGRYEIYSILHPENIQPQQFINADLAGPPHIVMQPPLSVVAAGTAPQYQFWDGQSANNAVVFAIPSADILKAHPGMPAMINPMELFSDGFPCAGSYTVVVEDFTDPNKPPIYHTLYPTGSAD